MFITYFIYMFNGRTHDLSNEMNLVICRVGTVGRMLPISLLRVYLSVSAVSVSVMGSELHQFHSKSCKEKWNHKFDLANDCFHSLNILFNPYLGDWAKLCWETITLTFNPHQLTWIIRVKKKAVAECNVEGHFTAISQVKNNWRQM